MASRSLRMCAQCRRVRLHRGRGLCGSCHSTIYGRTNRRRDETVEEVEFLLPVRGAEDTAAALGMTPAAIARACYRAGRADLARPFSRLAKGAS